MARELQAQFHIDGISASRVVRFEARQDALRPFALEIEIVFPGFAELDAMIGKAGELSFGAVGEEPRVFFGVVEEATVIGSSQLGGDARGTRYHLRVVSRLALLARSVTSQIFQEMSVDEIVTKVLADHGISEVEWRLGGSYPKREYCVQYQESALAFVSRLCEDEGIYGFVEPNADAGETLVFADDSTTAAPMTGDPELPLRPRSAMVESGDAIYALRERERVRSGKFVLRDFDFKRPKLDMTATAEAKERATLEVYDYPGGYFEPSEGQRLAAVRLEEEQVERRTLEIEGVCARLAVGHTITIADAAEADGEYFVFSVAHSYAHQGGSPRYVARARLVPKAVRYRPPRLTPLPLIEGPQTATVVAPAGLPTETIHTDEHARCKVRFHWDRSGVTDDKASCWMRVSQLQTSGSMVLPRLDWEVVVEFLEGNPDRPIVTGRLYNGVFMPPYALPEGKTRTAIKTASSPGGGGSNEIRLEDKAGSEEIMMHAQYDMKVVVANNSKRTIGNNETVVVGNNSSSQVGGNQTTKITKGTQSTVGGDQTVSVGGNRKVEVNAVTGLTAHGSSSTSVGGNQFEMDGNPLEAMLALAAQAAASFASAMADNAIAAVQAHVEGALGQVMGPITALQGQARALGNAMESLRGGDLSAAGGLVAGAAGIPGAGQLAAAFGGGGGGDSLTGGPGNEVAAGSPGNALAAIASNAAHQALSRGAAMAQQGLVDALGIGGGGGGGASMANAGGPAGDVAGVDATDREKGPGHTIATIAGTHAETVGSMKVLASIEDIDVNVTGSSTVAVGAATIQLALGNYAETVDGSKNEKALGLVVLSKAGESETITGSKTTMVGGAILDKLKGSHSIDAGGPATFIGAFHKIEAKGAIVFKCGASEVVIDGGGVTVTSPLVAILAPKIQLPKKVAEV
jgi:type VI secretion system secreted protein VgrG